MTLSLVGISHHVAPVELRERVALPLERAASLARALGDAVCLSTCNRTEVYLAGDDGTRALSSLEEIAGEPLRMHFDRRRRVFELVFRHDPRIEAPSEIFVPACHYPHGVEVRVSDGSFALLPETQRLEYRHDLQRETHTLRLRPRA